jgi:HNH endonuclease
MMSSANRAWWNRYDRYLRSEGWMLTREACLRRDGYRCRRCGLRGSPLNPLQADHLSYASYNRTGRTPVDDLLTLCRHCHQAVSRRRFPRRSSRVSTRGVARFLLIAVVIWMLAALWRSEPLLSHRTKPPRPGNTLIIPARIQFHHRHKHHQPPRPPTAPFDPLG